MKNASGFSLVELLIVVGLSHLIGPSSTRKIGWGLSWIAVGAIILFNNLGVIAVGIGVLWPVALVVFGTNLVFYGARRRARRRRSLPRPDRSHPAVVELQ